MGLGNVEIWIPIAIGSGNVDQTKMDIKKQ
jgi:hypothetical protein